MANETEWLRALLHPSAAAGPQLLPGRPPFPLRGPHPDFAAELIRADDLLSLHLEGYNLRVVADAGAAHLDRLDATIDAYLIVTFPPQSIAESAYYNTTAMPLPPPPPPFPVPPAPPATVKATPGRVAARIAGPSRLAFRLPGNAPMPDMPYTIEGLLNWSAFELVVPALADIPAAPTAAQVAAAPDPAAPGRRETAIELPYRLVLAPDHHVGWRHVTAPRTQGGRTELWHTRLALLDGDQLRELGPHTSAHLRAVWSPDYTPNSPPAKTALDPDLQVTAVSPNDRYQLVVLTSAFRGWANADESWYIPQPVEARFLMLSSLGGWLRLRGGWNPPHARRSIFFPGVLAGGNVRQFEPGVASNPSNLAGPLGGAQPQLAHGVVEPAGHALPLDTPVVAVPTDAHPGLGPGDVIGTAGDVHFPRWVDGEQLDLSEWVHVAAQGRDHYVRIVYEGHLYPFGHRAALVKVTERRFEDAPLAGGGSSPVAYLIQREFIVVREPEKRYEGQPGQPLPYVNAGREMPIKSLRLTTLVTPDLTLPRPIIPGTAFSSWIAVGADVHDFPFHAVATDLAGNTSEFTASLIFASLTDTGSTPSKLKPIRDTYHGSGARRACVVPGQKVTFAPRDAVLATDNTTLTTATLHFDAELFDTLPLAAPVRSSFGSFLPRLYKAEVRIPAVEQLLGKPALTTIGLYQPYLAGDLDSNAGVFASIVKDVAGTLQDDRLPVTFSADKAGGIATPNLNLSCLTRAHGPLAGQPANAAQDLFDANDFFGGFTPDLVPRLFGALKLTDILPLSADGARPSADRNAPKVQFKTIDSPGGKTLITTFDWTPEIHRYPPDGTGLVVFTPHDPNGLLIHGEIRKLLALPPAAPPTLDATASVSFTGTLLDFRVDLLNALGLNFKSFTFDASGGQKPRVDVRLKDDVPFEFEGDLAFVKDLTKIIPPGALGDGPSLDVTAAGVHVGYGVALPPTSMGVFALQNISFSAGLLLPFLSGKPVLDLAFASRHAPFLLTVSLLGGGGFFHVQLDTDGMKQLEVAFEFGASVDLDLGVASGGVHIMAGIYFAMQTDAGKTTVKLSGYLRAGGELSVLGLISVSLEFMLSFTYDSDHKASGRAILTVAVHVAFFSTSVELSVEKRFGGSGSDPDFAQLVNSAAVWEDYASAFA